MSLSSETTAYHHALQTWEEFHAEATRLKLGEHFSNPESSTMEEISKAIRILPPGERRPVAFGVFLMTARKWGQSALATFMGEFLSNPVEIEHGILDVALRGEMLIPEKLPVTLEDFPSRLWRRAMASGNSVRLIQAGHQAVRAILRLYFEYEDQGEPARPDFSGLKPGEETEFSVPSGDLPQLVDLLAIPPFTLPEMKGRILDRIMSDAAAGKFIHSAGQDTAFSAWVFADSEESEKHISVVIRQAEVMLKNLRDRKKSLYNSHHGQRLGRLLFRLGCRRESMRLAKALGLSPWESGWQHQVIRGSAHTRIRKDLKHHQMDDTSWETDPALACSVMSLPLWLANPVSRVPAMVELFRQATSCPWIFPRLHHVYQWHLALAGKHEALGEIETIAPDCGIGLAKSPIPRTTPAQLAMKHAILQRSPFGPHRYPL